MTTVTPPTPPPTAPTPGWYVDSTAPHQYRWWDGARWTEHTQPLTPPAAPASSSRLPELPHLPWVVTGLLLLVAGVLAVVILTGGDDGAAEQVDATVAEQAAQAQDSTAKSAVLTAQTAMETFATENDGQYTGVTLADLQAIEPSIPDLIQVTTAGSDGYTITIETETGTSFTVGRNGGSLIHPCDPPGTGGCPPSGEW